MNTYKTEAIVLHTIKYGDSSVIAYMLTSLYGRQNYIVQGVGKGGARGKSKKSALLQPMFPLEIVGLTSSKMELHRIKEVRLLEPLSALPFDIAKSTIALFMAEVIYRLVKEEQPDSELFDYVRSTVLALDGATEGVANFHLRFLAGLSRHLGFYPTNEYEEGNYFDITEGCFTPIQPMHGLHFAPAESALLDRMLRTPFAELGTIRLSRTERSNFLAAMLLYYGFHLDAINQVKSLKILSEIF